MVPRYRNVTSPSSRARARQHRQGRQTNFPSTYWYVYTILQPSEKKSVSNAPSPTPMHHCNIPKFPLTAAARTCLGIQLISLAFSGALAHFNPCRAPEPLPILNPSNFDLKNGFPVVKGLKHPAKAHTTSWPRKAAFRTDSGPPFNF